MSVATEHAQDTPGAEALPFSSGTYSTRTASGKADGTQVCWKVEVHADGHMIIRDICYDGKPWNREDEGWEPEGVIWPTWPARSEEEAALAASPLADVQKHWSKVGDRLRDSAKWMAAVLGAALATVVGTSPVADHLHLQGAAIALGLRSTRATYFGVLSGLIGMQPSSQPSPGRRPNSGLPSRSAAESCTATVAVWMKEPWLRPWPRART